MTLNQAPPGLPVRVEKVATVAEVSLQLLELGLVPGTVVVRQGGAAGGVQVSLRGYTLSLQAQEAAQVWVRTMAQPRATDDAPAEEGRGPSACGHG
ncbi:MAG: FeoA family protein [Polyangiales bacterium]